MTEWLIDALRNPGWEETIKYIGNRSAGYVWDDKELTDQIGVLKFVIAYLEGRSDCGIVVQVLRHSLEFFNNLKSERNKG